MAKLENIASLMNVTIELPQHKSDKPRAIGKKRRAWISNEQENHPTDKGVYRPLKEKGSINQVDQPGLSTGSINQVDQPGLENGSIDPILINLEKLRGNPLQLIQLLFALAKEKVSQKTTVTELTQLLDISRNSVKTALKFLIKNHLVERINFKPGRAGWSEYLIKNSLREELKEAIKKGFIDPFNIRAGKGSISSSSNINNKTTTKDFSKIIEPDWDKIDFELLTKIGFSKSHLYQLYKTGKTTAEIVQESINHFAYALEHNDKYKNHQAPLNLILGVLRKGQVWIEQDYKSPQEIAQIKLLEQKANKRNRIKKLEEDAFHLAYTIWVEDELSDAQREEITSNSKTKGTGKDIRPQTVKLREYFRENIWPNKKHDFLTSQT